MIAQPFQHGDESLTGKSGQVEQGVRYRLRAQGREQNGAQGGQGKDLVNFFNEDGLGAIVNSSRGIIAAYKQEKYASFGAESFGDASRAAVEDMAADIRQALEARRPL